MESNYRDGPTGHNKRLHVYSISNKLIGEFNKLCLQLIHPIIQDYILYIVNKHPILNCSNPSGKMPMMFSNIALLISILNRFSFALGF